MTTLSYRHITRPLQRSMSYLHPSPALSFKVLDLAGRKSMDPLTRNIFFPCKNLDVPPPLGWLESLLASQAFSSRALSE